MSAYADQIRTYIERFRAEVRNDGFIDPHELAEWAYENGFHKPAVSQVIDLIARDIANVFREEYRVDKHGRRYRAKHAVKETRNNKTMALWADLDDVNAPRSHFVKSFAQRRSQIVGDCVQLKIDVDVYNDKGQNEQPPINLVLNFTNDVEEQLLPHYLQAEKGRVVQGRWPERAIPGAPPLPPLPAASMVKRVCSRSATTTENLCLATPTW